MPTDMFTLYKNRFSIWSHFCKQPILFTALMCAFQAHASQRSHRLSVSFHWTLSVQKRENGGCWGQSGHRRLHTPSCLGDSFPCIGSMVDWHIYLYIYHEKSTIHVGIVNIVVPWIPMRFFSLTCFSLFVVRYCNHNSSLLPKKQNDQVGGWTNPFWNICSSTFIISSNFRG